MSFREAIHILMLSPIYFHLTVPQRLKLVREFCKSMNELTAKS
jgi:hypothetical protein